MFQIPAIAGLRNLIARETAKDKAATSRYLVHGSLIAVTFCLEDVDWIDRVSMGVKLQRFAVTRRGDGKGFHQLDDLFSIPLTLELCQRFDQ